MNELVPILKQFGPWAFGLIVVTYFLIWHLWPHWKAQSEREQLFRHRQFERVQEREDQIGAQMASLIKENTESNKALSVHVTALTDEIRAEFRTRRK